MKRINKILALFLVIAIIVSSVGFVHVHHFHRITQNTCNHKPETHSCCSDYCNVNNKTNEKSESCKIVFSAFAKNIVCAEDCCFDQAEYIKISPLSQKNDIIESFSQFIKNLDFGSDILLFSKQSIFTEFFKNPLSSPPSKIKLSPDKICVYRI